MAETFEVLDRPGPLRVLVVGTGGMGMAWLRAVDRRSDLALVGVADVDQRRAKGALLRLRRSGIPVAGTIAGLDPVAADACVNVTPPDAHAEVIAHALGRGLAVLSEKPLTTRLSEAVRLTALARERGVLLMAAQSRSYEPGLLALRDLVPQLGPISMVTTELGVGHPARGFRSTLAQPLLQDMAVHAFDAVRRVTGRRAVAAYCDAFDPPGSGFAGPAAATAVFELAGGARFGYTGSWCVEHLPTSWNGRWRVTGAHGVAEWDGTGPPRRAGGDGPWSPPDVGTATDDPVEQVARPLADFVRALRTGVRPWGEGNDNLDTLAMVETAVASAGTGRRMPVERPVRAGAAR